MRSAILFDVYSSEQLAVEVSIGSSFIIVFQDYESKTLTFILGNISYKETEFIYHSESSTVLDRLKFIANAPTASEPLHVGYGMRRRKCE